MSSCTCTNVYTKIRSFIEHVCWFFFSLHRLFLESLFHLHEFDTFFECIIICNNFFSSCCNTQHWQIGAIALETKSTKHQAFRFGTLFGIYFGLVWFGLVCLVLCVFVLFLSAFRNGKYNNRAKITEKLCRACERDH